MEFIRKKFGVCKRLNKHFLVTNETAKACFLRRIIAQRGKQVKTKLRTEIITETTREITLRMERRSASGFFGENCKECSAKLLTLNEAVQLSGLVWDEIVRLIKTKEIHSTETPNGEVYVCAESILNFKQ